MSTGIRVRIGAALAAIACAASFAAAPAQTARAASAYSAGFIAYGSTWQHGWTVLDPMTGQQHTVTPSGVGYDATTLYIPTIRYSPDAQKVAFVTVGYTPSFTQNVWVADADGTHAHRVAEGEPDRLAWSPDGSRVLFGPQKIWSVPANGSGPPTQAFPDPCLGTSPQVTTRGYVFYNRQCSITDTPQLAVYRPGDASPSIVSSQTGVISPDGKRVAHWISQGGSAVVTVDEIGEYSLSNQVATFDSPIGILDIGPSGDIAVAYQWIDARGSFHYMIGVVADTPNATPHVIIAGNGGSPGFLQWVNGPSRLPTRPIADRIGGPDRIATAINASQWAFDGRGTPGRRATVAVLTRDDLFPDALAGTALAVQKGGPLLLTPGRGLAPGAGEELVRVLSPGSTVYLLGGPAALSPAVADTVRHLGFNPVRLGGPDRYATAVAVATAISGSHPKSVLLATGTDFPDALTAGTAAGQERYSPRGTDAPGGGVVLLTDGATMPPATLAYLNGLHPDSVSLFAVGGPAAAAMSSALARWPTRTAIVGSDRYDTAAKVAASALYGNGTPGRYTMAAITTGTDFPDAMSGGALAGSQDAPLLLAGPSGLSPAEDAILRAGHLADIAVIGGPAAVSNRVLVTAADTAFGPHNWGNDTNRLAPPLR